MLAKREHGDALAGAPCAQRFAYDRAMTEMKPVEHADRDDERVRAPPRTVRLVRLG